MKTRLALVMVVLGAASALGQGAAQRDAARVTFEAAKRVESVDGDLKAASELYRTVSESGDRELAVQAHLRLSEIYRKLGDPSAQALHELLARNTVDQAGTAAGRRVPAPDMPVTSLVTLDEPFWSTGSTFMTPDGRYVSRRAELTGEIIITDLSTGRSERLQRGAAEMAMVSPDGRRVALVHRNPQTDAYEIQVQDRRPNSKPATILNSDGGTIYMDVAAWSHDSKSILLVRQGPIKIEVPATWEIVMLSVDDKRFRQIAGPGFYPSSRPSLSPDGRYIAYSVLANIARGRGPVTQSSIHVRAIAGSGPREVVKGASLNVSPVWTEDGSHILFLSNRGGTYGLYSVAVRNGEAQGQPSPVKGSQITGEVTLLGVTQSGVLHYVKESAGTNVLQYSLGPDGKVRGPSTRVSDNFVNQLWAPAYSPNGDRIALFREVGSNDFRLVVKDVNTGLERTYQEPYFLRYPVASPAWTPDGRSILAGAAGRGSSGLPDLSSQIRKFDLENETVTSRRLSGARNQIDGGLAVSPDGGTVYFLVTPPNIVNAAAVNRIMAIDLRDFASAKERDVWNPPDGVRLTSFALSPDGRTFAITTRGKSTDGWTPSSLARMGVDGTGYIELSKSVWPAGVTWTPDGRAILYRDEKYRLMRIPAQGGTPEFTGLMLTTDDGYWVRPPTGSQIAFTEMVPTELWKIEKLSSVLKGER